MSIQKAGYPNVSIKLYEDYDAWQENRFIELGATFTTLTLRDGLYGTNEGILQFYDGKNLHTKMNGEQIIQISVSNSNTKDVKNRIYGCKNSSVSVDEKGDNIIALELSPFHTVKNLKFSRSFFANATESIQSMLDGIYRKTENIKPKLNGLNVYVPRVPWVGTINDYYKYVREIGLSVESETHAFVWEDFNGVNLMDYQTMVNAEPRKMVVGDINQIGSYVQHADFQLAYDFVWLAKNNQFTRNPMENVTVYSHSFNDKEIQRITVGDGENSLYVSRSGGYSEMTYRNGYEEAFRMMTMAQYDAYASCKIVGDFTCMPGQKIIFGDQKNQFKSDFYIDEVIHVITSNNSETHLYLFTNGKPLVPVNIEKIKNEIENINSPSMTSLPEAIGTKEGAQWDLDVLSSVITALSTGRKSTGECALYVRKALQASQILQQFSGGLGNANEMAPKLTNMGWIPIGQNVTDFKKGDIAIFQRTNSPKGKLYGHICIWTGVNWISDFVQSGVQPNRDDKLTYTLYRARYGYAAGAANDN